jgi:thiaminase
MDQSIIFTRLILCHLLRLSTLPQYVIVLTLSSGRFINYVLERPDVQKAWKEHTEHAFVAGLADGTLPVSAFKYYLIQDYLFLVRGKTNHWCLTHVVQVQFARANALAGYKAKTIEDIAAVRRSPRHTFSKLTNAGC